MSAKSTQELINELLVDTENQMTHARQEDGSYPGWPMYAEFETLIPKVRAGDREALDRFLSHSVAGPFYRHVETIRTQLTREEAS